MAKITIAIPTYNREKQLRKTLNLILPQLTDETQLHIIDNDSNYDIQATIQSALNEHPTTAKIEIFKNKNNIGLSGNIMRALEQSNTPWVWLLSDDDKPKENAISSILEALKKEVSSEHFAICFKFDTADWHTFDIDIETPKSLLSLPDGGIINLAFLSAWAFKPEKLKSVWRYGYHYGYTAAPHLVLALMGLENRLGKVRISGTEVVSYHFETGTIGWSPVIGNMGLATLNELPLGKADVDTRHCMEKLSNDLIPFWIYLMAIYANPHVSELRAKYMLKNYKARCSFKKHVGFKERTLNTAASLLLHLPLKFKMQIASHFWSSRAKSPANSSDSMARL